MCFDGRRIMKKSDVTCVVEKAFKETKGSRTGKLFHQQKSVYRGVGERDSRGVLRKSCLHQQLNVHFQNKTILKPIRACNVQICHQANLISMESMPATWKGKTFKFVPSPGDNQDEHVPSQDNRRDEHVPIQDIKRGTQTWVLSCGFYSSVGRALHQ